MVVSDEATSQLNEDTMKLIKEMGSQHITKLRYRQPWAFIGIKGLSSSQDYAFEMVNEAAANSFAFVRN